MIKNLLFSVAILLLSVAPARAQSGLLCRYGSTGSQPCASPLALSWIPTGIPAFWLADGSVTNAEFLRLAGVTSPIQTQINLLTTAIGPGAFSVTAGAGLTGGGSAALGGSVAVALPNTGTPGTCASPASLTTDAQGRVTSCTPGGGGSATGSAVILAQVGASLGNAAWGANQYAGLGSIGGSNASTTVGAWRAPATGTVKNWYYTAYGPNPSGLGRTVTVNKASSAIGGGCGGYSPTAIVFTMPLAGQGAAVATSLPVTAGDCILFQSNFSITTGVSGSILIEAQYVPN